MSGTGIGPRPAEVLPDCKLAHCVTWALRYREGNPGATMGEARRRWRDTVREHVSGWFGMTPRQTGVFFAALDESNIVQLLLSMEADEATPEGRDA